MLRENDKDRDGERAFYWKEHDESTKEAREYLVNGEVADRERAYAFCLRERRILYKG